MAETEGRQSTAAWGGSEPPAIDVRNRERWLRERVDAALVIGRWESTTKDQLLRMLADALQNPGPLRTECTCPDVAAGRRDRNCPLHGVVSEDDPRDATPRADLDVAEELEIQDRLIRLRGYLTHIRRLGINQPAATKSALLNLLERLISPPEAYLWINEN